ncbi:E3 SUMO-protein ligase SIZ1-like [Miscanthus floridulus]|uniref:E3 SUMO-protein ligase SIZ1-like n=1 Tax=Miscanthus floridulus TaxID=154761 RepID=UPI003457F330
MLNDNMIKCEDGKCQVWQHITCVLIPDKPTEGAGPDIPPHFYCELCRLSRADPASVPQIVEKTFQLSRADRETVQRPEYDLQVWCILINDKVQFRMQWPQYA